MEIGADHRGNPVKFCVLAGRVWKEFEKGVARLNQNQSFLRPMFEYYLEF
jgi:hypothetical protein